MESSGVLGSDELELTVPGTTEALSAPSLYSSPPLQKPETTPSSNTSTRVSTLLNPVPPARKSSDSQPRDSRVSLCSAFRCSSKVHIQKTRSQKRKHKGRRKKLGLRVVLPGRNFLTGNYIFMAKSPESKRAVNSQKATYFPDNIRISNK